MHTQEDLRAALARRLASIEKPGRLAAFAVVRELNIASYLQGALAFTLAQPPPIRREWCDSFTRTAFLAGNYPRFAARYPADHDTRDGAVSWFGPAPPERFEGLRRLLRAFTAAAPVQVPRAQLLVTVPGEQKSRARRRRLTVALAGLSTLEYLVHVNHAVCEAAVLDLLRPGDRLEVVHRDEIDEPAQRWVYARVAASADDPSQLGLYACLTSAEPEERTSG